MKNLQIIVDEFTRYLVELRYQCNRKDNLYFTIPEKIDYVKKFQNTHFSVFSDYWGKIWNEIKDEHSLNQSYNKRQFLCKNLKPYFIQGTLNTRIYDKPLGYNGDYLTIYYLFLDYLGETIYEILLNQYSRSIPVAIAHKNRFCYLKNKFDKLLGKKIFSLGCGPALELLQYSAETPDSFNKLDITLLDMEQEALDFVKFRLKGKDNVQYLLYPIRKFLSDISTETLKTKKYDFIYCFGLFDYLNDRIIKKLLPILINSLNKNGKLIITNVNKNIDTRGYFEFFYDWKMYLRNENDLLELAKSGLKANASSEIYIDKSLPNQDNVYLVIEKP